MQKKSKCAVCGKRFKAQTAAIYQAAGGGGVIRLMSEGAKTYDAADCPRCGCQVLLATRFPAKKEEE
jgi:DNA-directed RNA polymerase subunit RPC12/RpoP